MHVIVVGAGVTGIACAHSLLKNGHAVTLVEAASSPNQGASFAMAGFMGPLNLPMLCAPFKAKAGLASIFAKTRRLGWDVSLSQMKFLRALANARSADQWAKDHQSLISLARASVGLTELESRLDDLNFEQVYGLLRVFTSDNGWEQAHKDTEAFKGGYWLDKDSAIRADAALEDVPNLLGAYFMPQELSGNGSYYSKITQAANVANPALTMMYHTKCEALLRDEQGAVTGIRTDKGEVLADAVILSNNLGVKPLIEGILDVPVLPLTGWTITAKTDVASVPPTHSVFFENKDMAVMRMGARLRVCGRFWLGDLSNDMAGKILEELYEEACRCLPMSALWREASNWMGVTAAVPDSLPCCGSAGIPGLYLNFGHGLNGWALAAVCAQLLTSLIEGSPTVVPAELCSPERFMKKH